MPFPRAAVSGLFVNFCAVIPVALGTSGISDGCVNSAWVCFALFINGLLLKHKLTFFRKVIIAPVFKNECVKRRVDRKLLHPLLPSE